MKVLLAEDDSNVAIITQLCLEKIGGHQVVLVSDGEQALQLALRGGFDLILLDGMMPKRSGLQVAMELSAQGANHAPIIFLSAKSEERDIDLFLQHGTGYIAKPFEPQEICARIEAILKSKGKMPA